MLGASFPDAQLAIRFKRFWSWNCFAEITLDKAKKVLESPRVSSRFCNIVFRSDAKPLLPTSSDYTLEVETMQYRVCGSRCFLAINESLIVAEENNGESQIKVWLSTQPNADSQINQVGLVFSFAMEFALRRINLFPLHSAAVIEPQSQTASLILGSSGSGKSTLTAQLARLGWSVVGDDTVLLQGGEANQNDAHAPTANRPFAENAKIEAHGFRRFLALTPTSLAACGLSDYAGGEESVWTNDNLKLMLHTSRLFPEREVTRCTSENLFFADITNRETTSIRLVARGEAMMRLLDYCLWARAETASVAQSYIKVLSALVNQSRTAKLDLGRDVLHAPEKVEALLKDFIST